jgi:hypothetical protein
MSQRRLIRPLPGGQVMPSKAGDFFIAPLAGLPQLPETRRKAGYSVSKSSPLRAGQQPPL